MDVLTLGRYILEMSLMDYKYTQMSDSKVAAAALLLAVTMKKTHTWVRSSVIFIHPTMSMVVDIHSINHAFPFCGMSNVNKISLNYLKNKVQSVTTTERAGNQVVSLSRIIFPLYLNAVPQFPAYETAVDLSFNIIALEYPSAYSSHLSI